MTDQEATASWAMPLYEHDCEDCHYLGSTTSDNENVDLYWHDEQPTVIARWSSEGSDYLSGLVYLEHPGYLTGALREGYLLARDRGLVDTDVRAVADIYYLNYKTRKTLG
jgi:hypothetical protein